MSEVFLILASLKIGVFLAVLVLSFLVDILEKKNRAVHGLNLMAVCFMLIALTEFFHIIAEAHKGFFPWLLDFQNVHLITKPLLILAGLGIIWYFYGIRKNIKDYY